MYKVLDESMETILEIQSSTVYSVTMIEFFPSRTVAIGLFGFDIHWYGILYVLSFLIAIVLYPRLQKLRGLHLTNDLWMDIVAWVVAGVLVGGRLGFVLFYEPRYFFEHPLQIFAVWEGGMASHGGFIGVTVALVLFAWRRKLPLWAIADITTVPATIGLGLGRIGNFINQELYGTVTTLPWGIRIPGADGLRHPLQIYDALLMFTMAALFVLLLRSGYPTRQGRIFSLFLVFYGVIRFCLEFIRVQEYPPFVLSGVMLTRGQFYTLLLFLCGVALWFFLPRVAWKRGSGSA